jgi:DNA polymerase-3 subunit epsilon
MVPVRQGCIRLGESFSTLVRPEEARAIDPDSIRAHHLLPGDVREAPLLEDVLREVDRRIRGEALLVHQAALDVPFLRRAYKRAGLRWPAPTVVDTVVLLLKTARRARFLDPDASDHEPELNLSKARRRLGLPDYGAHDALTDAVSAAELFLVLRKQLGARTIRDLR